MSKKQRNYSPEFKIRVIMDMRDNHLSYMETVRKYWKINKNDKSKGKGYIRRLHLWERIFLEEGAEGLKKEHRGKASGINKERPPKLDKKVEDDLIAENQRLRMEIEYIKKLSALVLAEEQKNGKRRS